MSEWVNEAYQSFSVFLSSSSSVGADRNGIGQQGQVRRTTARFALARFPGRKRTGCWMGGLGFNSSRSDRSLPVFAENL